MNTVAAICDRNKSELTHKLTAAAAFWLDEAGFKPVETEVPVCPGWVADLSGVIRPTKTEATRLKLIPPRGPYSRPNAWREWCDAFAAIPSLLTAVVEVKTSRSDFIGDHKWGKPEARGRTPAVYRRAGKLMEINQ